MVALAFFDEEDGVSADADFFVGRLGLGCGVHGAL
jgi:hypothetical protein